MCDPIVTLETFLNAAKSSFTWISADFSSNQRLADLCLEVQMVSGGPRTQRKALTSVIVHFSINVALCDKSRTNHAEKSIKLGNIWY